MHPVTVYVVIAILTFGLFSGINLHEFVDYGDTRTIVANDVVDVGLGAEGAARAFAVEPGVAWQPLAWLSLQAQRDAVGLMAAPPYLRVNLALHVAATLVLLFALARLSGRFWPSAFVASICAVHPVTVETFAWASARGDVLAWLWLGATLAAWALWVERPGRARYAGVLVCAALGVLSGGRFGVLPFVLLVLDVWPLGRVPLLGVRVGRFADRPAVPVARLVVEKIPLLVLGLAGFAARLAAESGVPSTWGPDPSVAERASLLLVNVFDALGRILWPSGLAFTVPTRLQMGLGPVPAWQALLALVALVAITVGLVRLGARGRPILAGWLVFVVATLPVAGFVPMGLRMLNDRDLQLPLLGLALAVAFAGAWLLERAPRREVVAGLLAAAVLVPLAAAARAQAAVWRSSDALFDHALAVNERDAMAHYYKGMRLARLGFETAAIAQLERATDIYPDHVHANLALGQLRVEWGEPALAVEPLRRATAAMPDRAFARVYLAAALADSGDTEGAMRTLEEALRLEPGSADAYLQRARILVGLGRGEEAVADYRRALELDPSQGVARAELGKLERALARERAS